MKVQKCMVFLVLFVLVIQIISGTVLPAQATPEEDKPAISMQGGCGGEFPVVADSSVFNFIPDSAYGDGVMVPVFKNNSGDEGRSLLAFNLAGDVPSHLYILKAELELTIYESGPPYPYQFEVYNLIGGFDENTVTWNTMPALGERYAATTSQRDNGKLYIDITALAIGWIQGTISETLALAPVSEMDLSFSSREGSSSPKLVVYCAQPSAPTLPNLENREAGQLAGLERLKANSTVPVVFEPGLGGSVRFAGFMAPIPQTLGQDKLVRAQWFLDAYKDLLRLDNPALDLQLVRRSSDGLHLFFRQRVNGIPVFPSELAVQMTADYYIGLNGGYVPDIVLGPTPSLEAEAAEQLALNSLGGSIVLGETQLFYVNLGLLGDPEDQTTHLAWRVNVGDSETPSMVYLDAHTGQVLISLPHAIESFDLELSTGNNKGQYHLWPCWDWFITDDDQWFDENGPHAAFPDPTPPNPDAEGATAFGHSKTIYDYFNNTFGRDSFDAHGQEIRIYVHVGNNWNNANYSPNCDIFQFGDGEAVLDTMAHEFTHGVTQKTSNLVYKDQSGALNESFSDIFAHFVDNDDWLQGEDGNGGAGRSLSNPPAYGDPDIMSHLVITTTDHGAVHTNNGIHNKVAYLLTDGDTFNGFTITGIGQAKSEQLFHQMQTRYLTSNAQFIDARNVAVWTAYIWSRTDDYGFSANDVCQVRNAYAAVELGNGDQDCDGYEDHNDADDDNDGVPDYKDNCPLVANASQSDANRDGEGDACDPDMDGDGTPNPQDNCPLTWSTSQDDSNGNGVGDVCEDRDKDGYNDAWDNCINVYNPRQENQTHWKDEIGDACDPDRDGDGFPNESDNCPDRANDMQSNFDKDKYGDVCDTCYATASDNNTDTDKDGAGDPCDEDDDGDGKLDGDDNCPLTPNSDQFDGNHNDIGYACDANERNGVADGTTGTGTLLFPSAEWPWRMSLPVCDQCSHDYLPENFSKTIQIELEAGFRARVVDSAGMPVTTSGMAHNSLELTFFPAPHAAIPEVPLEADSTHSGRPRPAACTDFSLEADQIGYQLEIYPLEGTDPSGEYPIRVQITTTPYTLFLPMLKR